MATAPSNVPATRPPKGDSLKFLDPIRGRMVAMMNEEWFQREASFLLQAINGNDYLKNTTIASRMQVMVQLGNCGLTLDPVKKFAYVVPRNVKVKTRDGDRWESRCILEPSYMGLIKLATDTGSVKVIRAAIVYDGDDIDIMKGTTVAVRHVPYWQTKRDKGDIVAAYSVAVLHDGSTDVLDMGRDELEQVKATSESVKKKQKSPYDNWEAEMFRKAVIRRHLKTLPKSDRADALFHAIAADEEQFGSMTQAAHREAEARNPLRDLQLRLAQALDEYEGEDAQTLRDQLRAKIDAGEFTEAYGEAMLAEITGQGGQG